MESNFIERCENNSMKYFCYEDHLASKVEPIFIITRLASLDLSN